jgi:tetratricopeptide (TPR) repeat protein
MRPGFVLLLAALAAGSTGPLAAVVAEEDSHVLVRYDFDEETLETGPYTVMVFENSRGTVELTSTYRYSGHRAVEIRDVAGDGDFAELQGYFPNRNSGRLFVHFALMTATPEETFNFALAGPAHFKLVDNGIGLWLENRDGVLHHVVAGEALELFAPRSFTWYVVDLVLDIDAGTYDLTIGEEDSSEPVVAVTGVPNAVGTPGSRIHKFSFIGDVPGTDGSNVHLFVDDIVISADRPVPQGPFVAPGRRMLFVDIWDYWRRQMYRRPGCPPVLDHDDFGLDPADLQSLSDAGGLERYEALADGREPTGDPPEGLAPYLRDALEGVTLWREGCSRKSDESVNALRLAAERLPRAKLIPMSLVMALAADRRWTEADELFLSIYAGWRNDPRFPSISALLGIARGDLDEAESWLATTPEELPDAYHHPLVRRLWAGEIDRGLVAELKTELGGAWTRYVETALAAEHRYYVLLWQKHYDQARLYAERMVERFRALELPPGRWLERVGDAAFYAGDYVSALRAYEVALDDAANATAVLLKLSDVHFKLGNAELERGFREKIYGTLEPKTSRRDPAPGVRFDPCECPDEP